MVRKDTVVLIGFVIGVFLLAFGWLYFAYQINNNIGLATGNSVREVVGNFYETSSVSKRFLILFEIISFFVLVAAVIFLIKKFKKKIIISKKDYIVDDGNARSRTDLDILYAILKKRKFISIEDIEQTFKVDSEVALCWAKILEDGELAEIDYPRFGKPVLRSVEKGNAANKEKEEDSEEDGEKKDGEKKDKDEKEKLEKKKLHVKKVAKKSKSLVKKKVVKKVILKNKKRKKK